MISATDSSRFCFFWLHRASPSSAGKEYNQPDFCIDHLVMSFFANPIKQGIMKSVFIPIPKKGNAKKCSNYHTIALISHTSKVMLNILQARLQQYVNCELQMFKLVSEKAEEPEIKLPTSGGSSKKQSSRKTSTLASLTMLNPLTG